MKILRLPAVIEKTGLSKTTIYRFIGEGKFPAPVRIGERATGWHEADITQWMSELPSRVKRAEVAA